MDRRSFAGMAMAALAWRGLPAIAQAAPAGAVSTAHAPLGALRMVTIPAPDLDVIEAAYARYLGYRTIWQGTVPAALAQSWQASAVGGRRALIMEPESGDPTGIRFVEQAVAADFRPLTTYGWTAAEFVVQDPVALGNRLANSPFQIIGPPRPLDGWAGSMAMQAVGPAGEVLYFTHIPPNPAYPDPQAAHRSFVDHVFVGIATTPDMLAAVDFYAQTFANKAYGEFAIANVIISNANDLPATTMHRLNTVVLANGRMIEVDQAPTVARSRRVEAGFLAPGIGLMTFDYPSLDRTDIAWLGRAGATDMPPIAGRATATLRGRGSELIELAQS